MKKIIASVLVCITLFACEKEQQTTRVQQTQSQEEYLAKNKLNIPRKGQLKTLTPAQKELVQDWLEFNTVHENMKLINESTRFAIIEDLGQLANNIDEIEKKKLPKKLDVMQIRSRFLVLKTKALKLQDDATDDSIPNNFIEKEIVEMNKVFHAVCYQIQQASILDIAAEEILGDVFKATDSTNAEKKVSQKEQLPLKKSPKYMAPKQKSPKKAFKEVKPKNN
ncbi:hypothetical protein [uncultured Kordia sp.]|uniref:hypothetical protein n=1 Tax=uncultured Kordia sp. TaxID=507699 RepID=UPI0026072068|nr:hypothetical protein [uncultured Kordia sp.]